MTKQAKLKSCKRRDATIICGHTLIWTMLEKWKQWARTIKRDAHALYLAARDPRVPWYANALAIAVAAYALSRG
jgi:uncharacterized membrane protein YkvA (DUF1232 family)